MEKNKKINLIKAYIISGLVIIVLTVFAYELTKLFNNLGANTFVMYLITMVIFPTTYEFGYRVFRLLEKGKVVKISDIIEFHQYLNVRDDTGLDPEHIHDEFLSYKDKLMYIVMEYRNNENTNLNNSESGQIVKGLVLTSLFWISKELIRGGITTCIIINSLNDMNFIINYIYVILSVTTINILTDRYVFPYIVDKIESSNESFRSFNERNIK